MKITKCHHALFAVCGSAFLALAAPAPAEPVIINGSFELPSYPDGTINAGGGEGWIPSFMGGVVIVAGNIQDNFGNFYGVTPFGRQYLGLDPRTPQGFISRDSQEIDGFVAGETYALTLQAADSDGGQSPMLDVSFNDGSEVTYLHHTFPLPVGGPYGDVIQFNPLTVNFTAPVSGVITLSLTNAGVGGDPGSISVDDVSITRISGPEVTLLTNFDYPNGAISTEDSAINAEGTIVGRAIINAEGGSIGFIRYPDGTFGPPIVDPADTTSSTRANGINDARTVVGDYLDSADQMRHGFILTGTTYTDFTLPGPISTSLRGINNSGDFVGYSNPSGTEPGQAFIRIGGVVTELNIPAAVSSSAESINNNGEVVGYFTKSDGTTHGFIRTSDGRMKNIDYPGADSTYAEAINDRGQIVGRYEAGGVTHGFAVKRPSIYLPYDYAGASATSLDGINNRGELCGTYTGDAGASHGLVLRVGASPTK